MDPNTFDKLTKTLATSSSRRQALTTIMASVVGGAFWLRGKRSSLAMTTTPNASACCVSSDSLWKKVMACESGQTGCTKVDPAHKWVVMKNSNTNYLLVAGECISGIECSDLWENKTPNYWELAWNEVAKVYLSSHLASIGMAINAKWTKYHNPTRDYAQLHIHVSCIDKKVTDTLGPIDKKINTPPHWIEQPIYSSTKATVNNYRVLRLNGDNDLASNNLFNLVYNELKKENMGDAKKAADYMQYQTLVVAKRGNGGFYILNSDTISPSLNPGGSKPGGVGDGERLLYETC